MTSDVTIYHNPNCGTSRNVLAMLRERGIEPTIIEYLKTPPIRAKLVELIKASGLSVRQMMRDKGELYEQLDLAKDTWSDDQLLDVMIEHPVLINRPIVITPKGTRLCRPKERVLELLL